MAPTAIAYSPRSSSPVRAMTGMFAWTQRISAR
jgi:hypothetical protein